MLRRRWALAPALLAAAALGQPDDRPDGLVAPSRVTVGTADQLVGSRSPDGKSLYYVSTIETASEIYVQNAADNRARRLFDEGADASWPRVSPDGRLLSYVSFADQATGQLCVRELPKAESRRCLDSPIGAVQAEWIDGQRLALVVRDTIQGDLRLMEVTVAGGLSAKPLLNRNLTSPTLSRDGRWVVYVPVERESTEIGPGFDARAAQRLEAYRLDKRGDPIPFTLALPGLTAQPAFAPDGHSLYFVQFLHDTNRDGIVDGQDNGLLYRVAFPVGSDDAPAKAQADDPVQLTDGTWNCQYPWPSAESLLASCSKKENVDLYELPLTGEVPPSWDDERLKLEIELATTPEERLLLYHRRVQAEAARGVERRGRIRIVRLYLETGDFDAARFFAKRLEADPDPRLAGISPRLVALVDLRRAIHELEQGREVAGLATLARRDAAILRPMPGDSPGATALAKVLESEIEDVAGEKGASRRVLEQVEIEASTPRGVVELFDERAGALFRELDDWPALAAVEERLARVVDRPDLQLDYARAAARALAHGMGDEQAQRALRERRRGLPPQSELAFALELAETVREIRGKDALPARDALRALYRRQTRLDRKRAVVVEAVGRAKEFDADRVTEGLAQDYVEDVPKQSSERARAEALYRRTMIGRAFRRRSEGRLEEARTDFDQVVKHTGSLEALAGELDIRLKEGKPPEEIWAEVQRAHELPLVTHYARAYLLLREADSVTGPAHQAKLAEAVSQVREAWPDLKRQRMGQALFGALRHEEFLTGGDLAAAERANAHYVIALRQARTNPRQSAMLLGELGLLQIGVGNYRIALTYLDQREKLPYIDNGGGLAVRLGRARALLHEGREKEAADAADQAVKMTEASPKLKPYHVLALDRAALYNLAAYRFERALALYDLEMPSLEGRNLVVARLARAAAALGAKQPERTLADLAPLDDALKNPALGAALQLPHMTAERSLRTYRLISAGLRANAERKRGKPLEAGKALERRRALFQDKFEDQDRDEDLRAEALAESRLAEVNNEAGDGASAARWADDSLGHADQLASRTGPGLSQEQADALWLAGELATLNGAPVKTAVAKRMEKMLEAMAAADDPMWRVYQRWFEICVALEAAPR